MPQVRLDGCLLYYTDSGAMNGGKSGDREPLVMLMGLGGSHRSWGEPFLSQLERSFRVIALDHRGTGRSTRGSGEYSIRVLADDTAGAISRLGLDRAHVFGLSLGGMVAQELAIRHPDRVHGLVLASTTCGGSEAIWSNPTARRRFTEGIGIGESAWALVVTPRFATENGAFLQRIGWETLTAGTPPSVLGEQARAIRAFSTYGRLPSISAPSLIMTGDSDLLIPPANAHVLRRRIPGAEGVVVRDAGHVFVWEAPDRAASEVARFLTDPTVQRAGTGSAAL